VQAKALEPPEEVDDGSWVAGTPQQAIERIAAFREAGVERFFLNHFDHRDLDLVELVATDVLPHAR
jgi:alkanesulfonate monooxygenase SsuD/methylene tetrahydromethanopterin reductase-like flavin-dependent oxidoreductase (luciferase family)